MNTKTLLCGILFFAIAATLHAGDLKLPFKVSIVPDEGRGISIARKKPRVFYVVITNISDEPQNTWQDWNSWGFWAISFELTMPDGKRILINRNRKERFTKNSPATFIIPPGEHEVYPIQLDTEWDNRPTFTKAGEASIKLKAIYAVAPTKESAEFNVWTGRIESASYDLTLRHW